MAQQAINVNPGAISRELSQPLNSSETTETQSREGEIRQPGETSYSSKTLEGPPGICTIADIDAQVEANTDDDIDIDDHKWSSFAETKSNKKHHRKERSAAPVSVNDNIKDSKPLPSGWRAKVTEYGKIYYLNDITKKTQWEKPLNAATASKAWRLSSNVAKKMKGALAKISIANASEPSAVKIPQNTPTNTSVVSENDASPVAVQQNIDIRATERKRVHYEKHHQRRPSSKASPVVIPQDTAANAPKNYKNDVRSDEYRTERSVVAVSVNENAKDIEPLPAGWRAKLTENGCVYYLNDITKKTQWEKPVNAATASIASQLGNKMTKLSIASASEASPVVIPQHQQTMTRVVVVNDASPVTMRQNTAMNIPVMVVKDVSPVVMPQNSQILIAQRTDTIVPEINIEPKTRHRTSTIGEKTLAKRSNEEHGFIFLGILLAIAAIVIDIFAYSEGAIPTDRILVEVLKAFLSAISFLIMIVDYNTGDCECLRMGLMITACLWWVQFCGDCGFRCYEKTSKKLLIGFNVFLWAICAYFDAMELIERGEDRHLSLADWILILEFGVSLLGFTISFGNLLVKMCETMIKFICRLICTLVCVVAIISIIITAGAAL